MGTSDILLSVCGGGGGGRGRGRGRGRGNPAVGYHPIQME